MATQKKNEKKHYYYDYLIGKYSSKNIDKLKFLEYLKSLFFNFNTYMWLPSKYKDFVRKNNLNSSDCYKVLSNLNISNQLLKQKGYSKFLEKIEKYNQTAQTDHKIKVSIDKNMDFLKDLEKVKKKYLSISKTDFIAFISRNFDTGYSERTLYRKYFEKEME